MPYPAARRSLVHERDVADAAVTTLLNTGHDRKAYVLTGPDSLTQADQVLAIGTAVGRTLRAVEQGHAEARQELERNGFTTEQAERSLSYWRSLVEQPELVSDDHRQLTGSSPRDFTTWADDHAHSFRWR